MTGMDSLDDGARSLWEPSEKRMEESRMQTFMRWVAKREGLEFKDYFDLYDWSVAHIERFWEAVWEAAQIRSETPYDKVVEDPSVMPGTRWFPGARLNFAENLLRFRDDKEALVFRGENGTRRVMTYRELYALVAKLAVRLKRLGVKKGDRVAGYVANLPETAAAMLAATSLGAVWTSCSPDFGLEGAYNRFGQVEPTVLFAVDGYFYGGKTFDRREIVSELARRLPTLKAVVVLPFLNENPDLSGIPGAVNLPNLLDGETATEIAFVPTEPDHPVYILYSSGTTGPPKCITHGAAGTLVQHWKELALHTDVSRESSLFYFTTCGWMMWNWMVSALMTGARVVLYDGSPFHPGPEVLWRMAEEERLTVFGTSARYLAALQASGLEMRGAFDLSELRTLLSTGSPLPEEGFRFVYGNIKRDVQLSSISGGTDIISCFMLGCPTLPVYSGEIQCFGLGMKVEALDDSGTPVIGKQGELVCSAPAPSMPVFFWNDPGMEKYRKAYFDVYPGRWRHGDFMIVTPRRGIVMLGRSDATLNPGGVRIGTAEIYNQVERIGEIRDSLVVSQRWDNDSRIVLFVKLVEGMKLDAGLEKRIRDTIRKNATPRHVPAKIVEVPGIPYTKTGKKVELAVHQIIHGEEIRHGSALANPEVLDGFKNLEDLKT